MATQFVPTKTIKFTKNSFQTVVSMAFPTDGWHLIPLDALVQGEGENQVDEGGELVAFIVEAAGNAIKPIDYEALLKCKVSKGVVESIYTPGIMGADDSLYLVSGENRFPVYVDKESQKFRVGNLTGSLAEREYERADGTTGKSISVFFYCNNPDLKVNYSIPLVFKKWEDIADLLPDSESISKELLLWILQEHGVSVLSQILLQTLSSSGTGGGHTKKLPELGIGCWRLIDWQKLDPAAKKGTGTEKPLPSNYRLTLQSFEGRNMGSFYSNKGITEQLNTMSPCFRELLSEGRELQLRISDIYKVGQYDAATAAIQLRPPTAANMKSANVTGTRQLSGSQPFDVTSTALDPDIYDVDQPVRAVPIDTDPGSNYDSEYDPIPF